MVRKDLLDLKSNRKWASSHTLDVGIIVETKNASSSTITYPKLKKLPPLTKCTEVLDLTQNPYSRDKIYFSQNYKTFQSQKSKETVRNQKKKDVSVKLKSLNDLLKNRNCECINISNYNESYQIPVEIAFKSPTIKHIIDATRLYPIFKESNGSINFSVSDMIMKEVLCFMYSPSTYEPGKENILQILEFGMYLGLQELVEICCNNVCTFITDIENLDDLPDPIALKIYSQLELAQLIEWEFKMSNRNHSDLIKSSYIHHFNSNISSLIGYTNDVKFDSSANYESFCRESCIQWFLDTSILKLSIKNFSFKNLLSLYGQNIKTLSLKIDGSQVISTNHAANISGNLKNLKYLTILFLDYGYQTLNLLEILSTPSIEKLCLCFGNKESSVDIQTKTFSRLLKSLCTKRRSSKLKRNTFSLQNHLKKLDVSGINHFTSEESSVSELMADSQVESFMEVILNFYAINDEIINHFEQFNQSFTSENVSGLCFSNINLYSGGVVALIQELPNFKYLQTLNVAGVFASDEGICYLMKNIPPLQFLDISRNIKSLESLESLEASKLIAKYIMRKDSCLTELNLSGNRFSLLGIKNILESLDKSLTPASFDLSDMEIKSCLTYLSKSCNSKVTGLNLANNSIISRELNDFLLVYAFKEIDLLDLSGNHLDQTVLDSLADLIANLKFPNLKKLKLSGSQDSSKLEDGAFEKLLLAMLSKSCANLQEVDLSNHMIGDQICKLLAQVCLENRKLQVLNLENNRITFEGVKCFALLGNKKSRIFRINFRRNCIDASFIHSFKATKKWRHYFCFENQMMKISEDKVDPQFEA